MALLDLYPGKNHRYKYTLSDPEVIEILLRYITRTREKDLYPAAYVGYLGFPFQSSIESLINDFRKTQMIFRKTKGRKAKHEIVSFTPKETYDKNGFNHIHQIAYFFAQWYYLQGYQVVFAIHLDTDNPHIHYVVNSVNFVNGEKYHTEFQDMEKQKQFLYNTTEFLTGRSRYFDHVWHYKTCCETLNPNLLYFQSPLNAATFAYEGKPQLIYY